MLSITTKKYEIEEKISLLNENSEEIYSFDMKLTADNLKQIKEALIGKDTLKLASKIKQIEKLELDEEKTNEALALAEEMNKKAEDLIGKLCFGEHREEFIELGGKSKYDEMVETISDFLLITFMKKQIDRTNTINSDLTKISKK